jgi:hypothetical protein
MAVLDYVVEVLGRRDHTRRSTVIRPKAISIRHLFPVITLSVMRVDLVTINFRDILCGFVEFVNTVESISSVLD